MYRPMQLFQPKAPSVAFQHEIAYSLVLKKAAEAPWTVRQAVELCNQWGKVEALLAHPPAHLICGFPAAHQAQISALLDGYQQAVDTFQPILAPLLAGALPDALAFTKAEVKRFESAVVRLTEAVNQLEEVTCWLDKSFDLSQLNGVISTMFVLASLLYATISLVGMLLALAFPPWLAPLASLAFACAHAVHHLGNQFYGREKQHALGEWNQYKASLKDFAVQLQKIKESIMWSELRSRIDTNAEATQQLMQSMQRRLETLEQRQPPGAGGATRPVLTGEPTDVTLQITGSLLPSTGSTAADFEDAAQSFVNAGFAEGLSYEQIRQAGIHQLEAAIVDHQMGRNQQQQHAQDNLAAVQRGN